MSFQAMAWAAKQPTGDPASKLLLLMLANYADDNGKAWPSQATLSKVTEMSERSIRRHTDALVEAGLVTVETHKHAGGTKLTYWLGPDCKRADPPPANLSGAPTHRPDCPVPPANLAADPINEPTDKPPQGAKPDRLIDGWLPSAAADAWARAAYPNMDMAHELEKFRDHFLANGERKLDWNACYRNWIRRAATFHRAPVVRPQRLRGAELDARNAASLRASLDALYREGSEAAPQLEQGAGQGRPARAADGSR